MRYLLTAIIACLLVLNTTFASEDWGRNGHRATGEIAEKYLTRKATKAIDALLNGQSLALASTYADEIKSDPQYREYGPWHYVNYPFDSSYDAHPKNDRGDLIQAIDTCIKGLKDPDTPKEQKVFYLKLLIHFIGDLHQPLHVGKANDKGGNDFQVLWFDEGTNLHSVWDTRMIESYNMSYSELAANEAKISNARFDEIRQGTVTDWMNESRELCLDVYNSTEVGENLGYNYMYKYLDVVRSQLQKGGIRLAYVLNDIFG